VLLLPLVLRVELTRDFIPEPLGFCQHVVKPRQHLPEPIGRERLAFPVLGHELASRYVSGVAS
jgi:hypothetical protein